MAVDSMLYQISFPAGSYTAGTKGAMALIRGPSVVRDGCGTARLVKIFTASDASGLNVDVHVKNGQWNDEIINAAPVASDTILSDNSHAMQKGGNFPLVVNSGFDVSYEIMEAATTTAAVDVFCQIDIDYDGYPSIADPRNEEGMPMSLEMAQTITNTAAGSPLVFTSISVDVFKAGYKYLLTDAYFDSLGVTCPLGFLSITNAAGQGGLERLVPVYPAKAGLSFNLDKSVPLTKGPMTLNFAAIAAAAVPAEIQLDFIRR